MKIVMLLLDTIFLGCLFATCYFTLNCDESPFVDTISEVSGWGTFYFIARVLLNTFKNDTRSLDGK